MGFRKYIGIFFFLTLITSTVFGYVPENSRQGFSPISAESQPGKAHGDEELHQGSGQESTTFASGSMFGFDHDGWHYGRHFGKVLTPFLFTGRRWDGFSQTYNHRNRQMNPKFGRFISRDPVGFELDVNLYRYGYDNPTRFTDPTGEGLIASGVEWICHRDDKADKCYENYRDNIQHVMENMVKLAELEAGGLRRGRNTLDEAYRRGLARAFGILERCLDNANAVLDSERADKIRRGVEGIAWQNWPHTK